MKIDGQPTAKGYEKSLHASKTGPRDSGAINGRLQR
jgi:hypothetical protein